MTTKRLLQHAILLSYLLVLACAYVFLVTDKWIPIVPYSMVRLSYGMMAPYQGYITEDWELVAEGKKSDGTWEVIDMHPYLPYGRGEQIMRGSLLPFRMQSEQRLAEKYAELAEQLQMLEAKKGNSYEEVRFMVEQWPASPAGYGAYRVDPYITRTPIETTP